MVIIWMGPILKQIRMGPILMSLREPPVLSHIGRCNHKCSSRVLQDYVLCAEGLCVFQKRTLSFGEILLVVETFVLHIMLLYSAYRIFNSYF